MIPIIEKIQKLLNLANSENEHEAKLAASRASELLIKHNLSLQQILDHDAEYIHEDMATVGLQFKPHQLEVAQLLNEFFFVHVTIGRVYVGDSSGEFGRPRNQYKKLLKLIGTKENVQIATYVFAFLDQAFPKLWKDYYDTHAYATKKDQKSYYMGLRMGVAHVLNETKFKVQEEMGLVLVKDPKLQEKVDELCKGNYKASGPCSVNREVVADGLEDGKNVKLRKPIENKSSDQSLCLEHK